MPVMTTTRLFTFGLVYKHGEDRYVEEIDVHVRTGSEALAAARALAASDYEPGWVALIDLPAGGSGGLVVTL